MTFLQELIVILMDLNHFEAGQIFGKLILASNEFFVLPIFRIYMVSMGHWRNKFEKPEKDLNKVLKFYRDKQPEQHHSQFWTTLINGILAEYQSPSLLTKKYGNDENNLAKLSTF